MKLSVEYECVKTALDRVKEYRDLAVSLNLSSSKQDSSCWMSIDVYFFA